MLFFPPSPSPPPSPNSGLCAIVSISLRPPLSFMLSHMPPDATVLLYVFRVSIQSSHTHRSDVTLQAARKDCAKVQMAATPAKKHLSLQSLRHPLVTSLFPLFQMGFSHQIFCIVFLKLSTVFEIIQSSSGTFLYQCLIPLYCPKRPTSTIHKLCTFFFSSFVPALLLLLY